MIVATDDGVPGNITTLPVFDADFTKRVKVSLSATEMTGENVTVIFSDAAVAEWYDLTVNLQTTASQVDDLATAASVASLGSGTGAALNFAAAADNTGGALKGVTFVGSQTLTYAVTAAEDGSRHAILDSGSSPDIDIVYRFNVGAGRNASKVVWKGLYPPAIP